MTLREKYRLAKYHLKKDEHKTADHYLDLCLVHLAKVTQRGEIFTEGASVDLWKTRVWTTIEKAGLLQG